METGHFLLLGDWNDERFLEIDGDRRLLKCEIKDVSEDCRQFISAQFQNRPETPCGLAVFQRFMPMKPDQISATVMHEIEPAGNRGTRLGQALFAYS